MDQFYSLGFTEEDIAELKERFDLESQEELLLSFTVLSCNLLFLKQYGCSNYIEVFFQSPFFFLLDSEDFQKKVLSYRKEELLPYLLQDPTFFGRV